MIQGLARSNHAAFKRRTIVKLVTLALLAVLAVGFAAKSAYAWQSCTTNCYGNTCHTTCY